MKTIDERKEIIDSISDRMHADIWRPLFMLYEYDYCRDEQGNLIKTRSYEANQISKAMEHISAAGMLLEQVSETYETTKELEGIVL